MDIGPWSETLSRLTAVNGCIGSGEGLGRHARDALEVLHRGEWPRHHIKADVDVSGKWCKPEAAFRAQRQRDALLRVAVAHGLLRLSDRGTEVGAEWFDGLVQRVIGAAMSSMTGLRPKAADSSPGPYSPVDFAHSENAAHFFNDIVRKSVQRLDKSLRTNLTDLAHEPYDARSDTSIEHWSRLWTVSAALMPLDWARARGCASTPDILRAFWLSLGPNGTPLRNFKVHGGTLPTGSPDVGSGKHLQVHVDLRATPAIAQVVEGGAHWHDAADGTPCSIHIPLKALDYVAKMVGATQEVYYHGRAIFQLYLAVLADCLLQAGVVARAGTGMRDPSSIVFPGVVAPAHLAGLQRIDALRATAAKHVGKPASPLRPLGPERTGPMRRVGSAPLGYELYDQPNYVWQALTQANLRFVASGASPSSETIVLGSLDLWSNFDREVDWVDLVCIGRHGDERFVLPVSLDTESADDESSDVLHCSLILRGDASTAQTLRAAFNSAGCVSAIGAYAGTGIFVVLEIDISGL